MGFSSVLFCKLLLLVTAALVEVFVFVDSCRHCRVRNGWISLTLTHELCGLAWRDGSRIHRILL